MVYLWFNWNMIRQIQKKEYKRLNRLKKLSFSRIDYIFSGNDGRFYKTDKRGSEAVKEIYQFQKGINQRMGSVQELPLIDVIKSN